MKFLLVLVVLLWSVVCDLFQLINLIMNVSYNFTDNLYLIFLLYAIQFWKLIVHFPDCKISGFLLAVSFSRCINPECRQGCTS